MMKALRLLRKSGLIFLVTVTVALLVVACASRPTPTAAPGSGSIIDDFPLGTFLASVPDLAVTLLGVAALDQGLPGHTAILSSTATLTVNTTVPTITCPGNIAKSTDAGLCSAVVTFTTTTGGSPAPSVTCQVTGNDGHGLPSGTTVQSGAAFAKGRSTVTCTALNTCGVSASCSFDVTVTDAEPPKIVCVGNFTMNADASRSTLVSS